MQRRWFSLLLILAAAFVPAAHGLLPTELKHALLHPGTSPLAGARHGASVAMDGNLAVVAAPDDDTGSNASGVVQVYDATSGALLHRLTNPAPQEYGNFGAAVAVQGTRVAVAAISDASGIAAGVTSKVYIYDLAGAAPATPVAVLPNPTPAAYDYFGRAVAISGTRVIVGATGDDTVSAEAGSAYVFDLASPSPTTPVLTLPGVAGQYGYGSAVATSGARVAIGALTTGFPIGPAPTGKVYVYDLSGGASAVLLATLTAPGTSPAGMFAGAVAMSGTWVVVGAYRDSTDAADAGRAYVFDLASVTPANPVVVLAKPSPAAADYFGYALAISGGRVVVGTAGLDSAFLYDLESATPEVAVGAVANPTPTVGDSFGRAIAIAGFKVVIGAPGDDAGEVDTGSAYLYDIAAGPPAAPLATLASASRSVGDEFGSAVAVSGSLVIVGAPSENSGATRSGSAYVYDLASATPTVPIRILRNPHPVADDRFGYAVAVSGMRVVVGAIWADGSESNEGVAYVYNLTSPTPEIPVLTLTPPTLGHSASFGYSLALAGARLVVGAPGGATAGSNAGYVCVYDLDSPQPLVPLTTVENPEPEASDFFGSAVAISGDRLVVGATLDGGFDSGKAYIFDLAGAPPLAPIFSLSSEMRHFGSSVAISGTRVIIGAYGYYDYNARTYRRGAYTYDLAGSYPTSPMTYSFVGSIAAMSGPVAVIGEPGTPGGSASVADYTAYFTLPQPIDNPLGPVSTGFAEAVALDGSTLVIGAETALARGVVYIYQTPTPDAGTAPPTLISPAAGSVAGSPVNVAFSLPERALGRSVQLRFQGPVLRFFTLASPYEASGTHAFSFLPGAPLASPAIRPSGGVNGASNLPDGLYTVTLSYQDAPGNFAASASVANVRIDATAPAAGTVTLAPAGAVDAGAALLVTFAGWTDASPPLSYAVLIDGAIASPTEAGAVRTFTGPVTPGVRLLKGRITDAMGSVAEVTQTFTVLTARESWRRLHFGITTNTGAAADAADPDGDGNNNEFEFVAGLLPADPASRFQTRVEIPPEQPASRAIMFGPVVAGRTYTVKYKASLADPAWTILTNSRTSESGTERTVTDENPGEGPRFYRVEITRQ